MRAFVLLLLFIPAAAIAQPYVFVGLGWADIKTDTLAGGSSQTFLPGVGYRFADRFAAEVGWFDFKQVSGSSLEGTTQTVEDWEAKGFALSGIAEFQMSSAFAFLARAGVARVQATRSTRTTDTTSTAPIHQPPSSSSDLWAATYGLGAQFVDMNKRVRLRIVAERMESGTEFRRIDLIGWHVLIHF